MLAIGLGWALVSRRSWTVQRNVIFETLTYIDRLKQAGIDETVARAHAEALRTALGETVATKDDLKDVRAEINDARVLLKAEINDVRISLKAEINDVRVSLKAEINDVRAEMRLMEQRLINAGQRGLIALAAFVVAVAGLAFAAFKAFG